MSALWSAAASPVTVVAVEVVVDPVVVDVVVVGVADEGSSTAVAASATVEPQASATAQIASAISERVRAGM
jgi:acyl-coenzyme A synthetase/AMP-(fatty) acid ligase